MRRLAAQHSPCGAYIPWNAEDGRIQAISRPGNARGNGLSTNRTPPAELPITEYTWTDEGPTVTVTVPLTRAADATPERVSCTFEQASFNLGVTCANGSKLRRLRVDRLPAGGVKNEARLHMWRWRMFWSSHALPN